MADVQDNRQEIEFELRPCGYRAKCTAPGCRNLARVIIRRVEAGGAPLGQDEFCNKDARVRVAEAGIEGMAVHDMRR